MDFRRGLGDEGESLAAAHLSGLGMRLLAVQYRVPSGEIDLIVLDGDEVVFVEVKTRRSRDFGYPEEAVTAKKVRRILTAVHRFLSEKAWEDRPWRVDVVALTLAPGQDPEILHFPAIDIPESLW